MGKRAPRGVWRYDVQVSGVGMELLSLRWDVCAGMGTRAVTARGCALARWVHLAIPYGSARRMTHYQLRRNPAITQPTWLPRLCVGT